MSLYHTQHNLTVYHGDCLNVMNDMEDNSVDSIVTDPPYGLSEQPDITEVLRHWLNGDDYEHNSGGFMGKDWDSFVPGPSIWKECLRVLKPGGHLLAFSGTRTQDLMGISLRLGGFEIRDTICWCFGSGFPKSLDISKAIDRVAGVEREVVGKQQWNTSSRTNNVDIKSGTKTYIPGGGEENYPPITAPATPEAKQWDGWGTGLKPAIELIVMCRKPISEKTIAANVLRWGTGAINIDGCRVGVGPGELIKQSGELVDTACHNGYDRPNSTMFRTGKAKERGGPSHAKGRWPANLILDDSDEVRELFPETRAAGNKRVSIFNNKQTHIYGKYGSTTKNPKVTDNNGGSAARFFKQIPCLIYQAKASAAERNEGLEEMEVTNVHPTIKPLSLIRYFVRLVTPPGGIVLDPFLGSGTTLKAAQKEFFKGIGIEEKEEYCQIAAGRLREAQPSLFGIGD